MQPVLRFWHAAPDGTTWLSFYEKPISGQAQPDLGGCGTKAARNGFSVEAIALPSKRTLKPMSSLRASDQAHSLDPGRQRCWSHAQKFGGAAGTMNSPVRLVECGKNVVAVALFHLGVGDDGCR